MTAQHPISDSLSRHGYHTTAPILNEENIRTINSKIDQYLEQQSSGKHAIRQLFIKIPSLFSYLQSIPKFRNFLSEILGPDYFLTKSIYFNKPGFSNWFVAYHQDLSISVAHKSEVEGYNNWTQKEGVYGVQPPLEVLENTVTLRIHLDATDATNGALRIIPKSHQKGIIRIDENIDLEAQGEEVMCAVEKGGIFLMKPLTLHASHRSTSARERRVLHLEFCNRPLTAPLTWLEKIALV